jgi:hypothetical protein
MPDGNNYKGKVYGDDFPNCEIFVVDDDKREALLFDFITKGGRNTGPARLLGSNRSQYLGTFDKFVPKSGPLTLSNTIQLTNGKIQIRLTRTIQLMNGKTIQIQLSQ